MKPGDLVRVSYEPGEASKLAIIIRDLFPNNNNKGRGFKIMFSNGQTKNKLAKYLEVV